MCTYDVLTHFERTDCSRRGSGLQENSQRLAGRKLVLGFTAEPFFDTEWRCQREPD